MDQAVQLSSRARAVTLLQQLNHSVMTFISCFWAFSISLVCYGSCIFSSCNNICTFPSWWANGWVGSEKNFFSKRLREDQEKFVPWYEFVFWERVSWREGDEFVMLMIWNSCWGDFQVDSMVERFMTAHWDYLLGNFVAFGAGKPETNEPLTVGFYPQQGLKALDTTTDVQKRLVEKVCSKCQAVSCLSWFACNMI